MQMQTLRESIPVERLVGRRSRQAVVEGEITLPGGLREEARVLQVSGLAVMTGAECLQDRVNMDGKVIFHVLYTQGDPSKVQAIEATADFSHVLELPGTAPRMLCRGKMWVEHAEASAYGGRLNVKAIVMTGARVLCTAPVETVTGITQCSCLQTQNQKLTLAQTAARGSGELLLREEFELPQALEITDTLYGTARAVLGEITGGQDRANVTGTVELEVYHASGMPLRPMVLTRHEAVFEHAVDMEGTGAQMLMGDVFVKDVAVLSQDAGDGSRILRAEVLLGLDVRGDKQEEWTVLKDAYTTREEDVELTQQVIRCRVRDSSGHAAESGKMLLMLPEGNPPVRTMLGAFATPILTNREQIGGRMNVEGVMEVTLLYMTDDSDEPVSVSREEPFKMTFAVQAGADDFVDAEVSHIDAAVITGDRVEMKYIMHLKLDGVACEPCRWIVEAAPKAGPAPKGGAALYFVQPGEGLWEIARRYRIPKEDLVTLNENLIKREPAPGEAVVVFRRTVAQ